MKKIGFGLLAIILLGGSLYLAHGYLVSAGEKGLNRPLSKAKVTRQTIKRELTLIGEIMPEELLNIRSEVSGRAVEVTIDIGDVVKKGQLLVRLDEKLLESEKRQLLVEISTAKYEVEIAKRNYKELKDLASDFASKNEVLNKEAELRISENNIKQLEFRLEQVEEKLKKVRILSPINGTIVGLGIKEGQVVAGAESNAGGTVVCQVADLDQLIVAGEVNQIDVANISIGQKGYASSILNQRERLNCTVDNIAPIAEKKTDGSRSFEVKLILEGKNQNLQPGMTTRVYFPLQQSENVISVPVQAVFLDNNQFVVFKRDNSTEEVIKTKVSLGLVGSQYIEIPQGLSEGETVLLERPDSDNPAVPRGRLEESPKRKKTSFH